MKHILSTLVMTSLLINKAVAGTMGASMPVKDWGWIISISGGPTWSRGGETRTFYLAPEIEKTYVAKKSTNALASGELFIGFQKMLSSQWQGQFGLAGAITDNANLQGIIWDDADPQFDNYNYEYKVRNSRVAIKGKLLFDNGYWIMPWVSTSLGVGFNCAHHFDNIPLIFEAVPNPNFEEHTKTTFTYTLGAGIQKSLNDSWQAGVGYEFADWGKSALGNSLGQITDSRLTLNHLYTNGVLFNLTYIA